MVERVQPRPNGAVETSRKTGLWRRLVLRRADGQVYLNRWGIGHDRIGGILLHRMDAPDPGGDLHDHPWWFCSIILWGGYTEERADTREAPFFALVEECASNGHPGQTACKRGVEFERRPGSVRVMRLDECHTITSLARRRSWSLVVKGPRRRRWGFYTPDGFVGERDYGAERRDMWEGRSFGGRNQPRRRRVTAM